MGANLGFVWIDRPGVSVRELWGVLRAVWTELPERAGLDLALDPDARAPVTGAPAGTFVSFFTRSCGARTFPLERVARSVASSWKCRSMAAFVSDYHELGGFQLWDPTGRTAKWLGADRYVDGTREGFLALYPGASIVPPVKGEEKSGRLFFTEDLFTAFEPQTRYYRLASAGKWLDTPAPVAAPDDYPTNCYVLELWPDPAASDGREITIEERLKRGP